MSAKLKAISLSEIGSAIAAGASVISAAETLKPYIAPLMETFENAYADSQDAGDVKLKSVLTALAAVAKSLAIEWNSGLEAALTALIATIKAAYNAVAELVTGQVTAATETAA